MLRTRLPSASWASQRVATKSPETTAVRTPRYWHQKHTLRRRLSCFPKSSSPLWWLPRRNTLAAIVSRPRRLGGHPSCRKPHRAARLQVSQYVYVKYISRGGLIYISFSQYDSNLKGWLAVSPLPSLTHTSPATSTCGLRPVAANYATLCCEPLMYTLVLLASHPN